jgi:hypothetical protein
MALGWDVTELVRSNFRIHMAMTNLLARLLCLIGVHDFRVLEVIVGFGPSGSVEKVECKRCGQVTTRRGEM